MEDAGDSADKQAEDARRFAAFISYSHADADAAAKLQRKLERYRLPKRIAEARAAKSGALGRIFRDREDFAAAVSLSAAIREAISQAEAMVAMCSPEASASPWVQAEIELFRQLHPGRPILAALLSGEPAVSFPAALTADGNEPLAADLRPGGDGEQLGFLKIVAGIAGVPLDELIQRDAQRRLRRVTAITGAALAAVLVMGIMTTLALQARNEAARQRVAAEGLVEYMLTDLREKLRGVGRIEIMDGVNAKVMDHYGGQGDLGNLPDDSLERRARVLHAIGEDHDRLGRLASATKYFRDAHQLTAAILARKPNNADRIFAHAQSEFWIGYAATRQNEFRTARYHWQEYLQRSHQLAKIDGRNVRSLMELGYAEGNLCEADTRPGGDLDRAELHCAKSIAYEAAALNLEPANRKVMQDLANRHGWMAIVQHQRKKPTLSAKSRNEEIRIMDSLLTRDPLNVEYALRYGWASVGLAASLLELNDHEQAHKGLVTAIEKFSRAATASSDDERVGVTDLRLHGYLAKTERALFGRVSPATRVRLEKIAVRSPKSTEFRALLAKILEEE